MPAFSLAVADFAKKAGANAELVIRKIGIEMLSRIVLRSPVDTGRFRANWQTGLQLVGEVTDAIDKSGAVAIVKGTEAIQRFQLGQSIWISNALPYARRLEYGYSKQAPGGMVRVTLVEFQSIVGAAAKGVA